MPSFDMVSEVDLHEVTNAVDQANRELKTRFDFRGVNARFEVSENQVKLSAEAEIQLDQMLDILREKFSKRSIDPRVIEIQGSDHIGKVLYREIGVQQGIDGLIAKKVVKMVKAAKTKVQVSIQGEKIRFSGKKRDHLQEIISLMKEAEFEIPLQFNNFRE
ncbi:MAG: YajQ family cyclic di-GMP-binding protein [Gammaproteobacteria bacterium]|nr:YajQ family cyclic di-GMP-binding protein [Gammaproteobacteria bacterium]|tara:strand:+ start:167 stop:649 length:483 start_codon:yes stop_codon:yes gene_type:complete